MYGSFILSTQNLAVSGANQVLINLISAGVFRGSFVVVSPSDGPLRQTFIQSGVAVIVGELERVIQTTRDIRVVICNTIMTAGEVLLLNRIGIPHLWILHEWWTPDILEQEFKKRQLQFIDRDTVDRALRLCDRVILVCESQRSVYRIAAPSTVIYVGVPLDLSWSPRLNQVEQTVTFLCMGVICPRKNQVRIVELFKKLSGGRTNARLELVGARYVRDYEMNYVKKLEEVIDNDPRISVHPVTSDPWEWYRKADVLLLNSLNEVTPLVICEAMLAEVPVITSDIAGIPEMMVDGEHGFILKAGDDDAFIEAMHRLACSQTLRRKLGRAARAHAIQKFSLDRMVADFARTIRTVSPVTILVDMDGVIVDWDKGFRDLWCDRAPIDRFKSYIMQECVPASFMEAATAVSRRPGFFASLPPYADAIECVKHLHSLEGFSVFICTSPLLDNPTCIQDKIDWTKKYFGPEWVERLILTRDKTTVRGDILIDDKPGIKGSHHPTWVQIVFDQPYNVEYDKQTHRMYSWTNRTQWKKTVLKALKQVGHCISGSDLGLFPADQISARERTAELSSYCNSYSLWRQGSSRGSRDKALESLQEDIDSRMDEFMLQHTLFHSEEFEEIFVFRKSYRKWRNQSIRTSSC
jgi:5'-nucleotidase